MKKKGPLLFILLCPFLLFSSEKMRVTADNVSTEVPLGWFAQYTRTPVVFYLYSPLGVNDTFQENGNLTMEENFSHATLEEYKALALEQLEALYTNFRLLADEGNTLTLTGNMGNLSLMQRQYYYLKGDAIYVLTLTATPETFADYEGDFSSIAQSIKIK